MKHIFHPRFSSVFLRFKSKSAARSTILIAVTACFGAALFLPHQSSVVEQRLEANTLSESDESPTSLEESLKWRRLGWVDEKGEISQDALSTAKQQRDANIACPIQPLCWRLHLDAVYGRLKL